MREYVVNKIEDILDKDKKVRASAECVGGRRRGWLSANGRVWRNGPANSQAAGASASLILSSPPAASPTPNTHARTHAAAHAARAARTHAH